MSGIDGGGDATRDEHRKLSPPRDLKGKERCQQTHGES